MIEKLIFGNIQIPGEAVRIALALAGTAVATYFDLFNNKSIPNNVLYAFLIVAFATNIFFFNQELFLFGIGIAVLISAIGFVFYHVGQLGAADVFVLASIALLLPLHPQLSAMPFNFPLVLSVLVFAGVLFSLYTMARFGAYVVKKQIKPKPHFLLLLAPYALFSYMFASSAIFSPVYFAIVSVMFISAIFFLSFKEHIHKSMAEKIHHDDLEQEDVLALEFMHKSDVEKHKLGRLLTRHQVEKIRKHKLENVWVFTKLPPFLPFVFIGLVLAILFARLLLPTF